MPTSRPRPDPVIPDHEVLRKIGGGAYGEVWLARGVTGALRAVKVVWRQDFEDERSFEREFEGILKFEPMSRDHPGLVNILHVGRSADGVSFYYYVMELGDDVLTGREINPIEYEARTLRSDVKRIPGKRLDTEFCIDVGVRLAEALRHLHDNGLAHRDVKPANVIFVGGKAKLADIGLVATRGQRTFVGTEGFVPPEGPGSAQADVYSLGKVLYEIASGKDRMDFPELPDDLPTKPERKRWLALNQIICDTCEPQLSKRRVSSAGDLADALRRLQQGKRRRRRRPIGAYLATILTGTALVVGSWEVFKGSPWMNFSGQLGNFIPDTQPDPVIEPVKAPPARALIKVNSRPEGAVVIDSSGEILGTTPTDLITSHVGEQVSFRLEKEGFAPASLQAKVPESAAEEPMLLEAELKIFSPPQPNEPWVDHLGQRYGPVGEGHQSRRPVGQEEWDRYRAAKERPGDVAEFVEIEEDGIKRKIVVTSEGEAQAFCWWLAESGIQAGFLTVNHQARQLMDVTFNNAGLSERARKENFRPFRCRVEPIPFARIVLTTEPAGAEVFLKTSDSAFNNRVGATNGPLTTDPLRPGEYELLVLLEGYKPLSRKVTLKSNETQELHLKLQLNNSVVMEKPWENGLGMKFIPLGPDFMASIWETRVKDYDAFVRAKNLPSPATDFQQGPDHPVVFVSRKDAEDFCAWLTEVERKQERLSQVHHYRLPTDYEWSLMADLKEQVGVSPARRDSLRAKVFLWGVAWPPPAPDGAAVANLADATASRSPGFPTERTIKGYEDGYEKTAPVGSFPPNNLGIYDLCGNVHEWVSDNYSPTVVSGVLRGGGWNTYQPQNLYIGARNTQPPEFRDSIYGFRVVLAKVPPIPETTPAEDGTDTDG
jgi:serine/threonine protein kinase